VPRYSDLYRGSCEMMRGGGTLAKCPDCGNSKRTVEWANCVAGVLSGWQLDAASFTAINSLGRVQLIAASLRERLREQYWTLPKYFSKLRVLDVKIGGGEGVRQGGVRP